MEISCVEVESAQTAIFEVHHMNFLCVYGAMALLILISAHHCKMEEEVSLKVPPIICSRRQFQILLLFKNYKKHEISYLIFFEN